MNITLILDNIRSVYNTASIFRTAECFGVSKIYVCGTTPAPIDRFGRRRSDFAKVALGAQDLVQWEYFRETNEAVDRVQAQGAYLYALEQSQKSIPLPTVDTQKISKCAIIVGYEVLGVTSSLLDRADEIIEIPQYGQKESLNVSVATGIALYHIQALGSRL